jgi:hypothetical protein
MMQQFFIVTSDPKNNDKYKLAEFLAEKYDMDIAYSFTSTDNLENYKVQYKIDEIILSYRNNALLCCLSDTINNIHNGITMDEFYNKDIFCLTIKEFSNISESLLCNSIVIWIDQPKNDIDYEYIKDCKNFIDILENIPYMYFNENLSEIYDKVSEYIEADDNKKLEIIELNS